MHPQPLTFRPSDPSKPCPLYTSTQREYYYEPNRGQRAQRAEGNCRKWHSRLVESQGRNPGGPAADPGLSNASLFCVRRLRTSEPERRTARPRGQHPGAGTQDPARRVRPGSQAGPQSMGTRWARGATQPQPAGGRGRGRSAPRPAGGLPGRPGAKVRCRALHHTRRRRP